MLGKSSDEIFSRVKKILRRVILIVGEISFGICTCESDASSLQLVSKVGWIDHYRNMWRKQGEKEEGKAILPQKPRDK